MGAAERGTVIAQSRLLGTTPLAEYEQLAMASLSAVDLPLIDTHVFYPPPNLDLPLFDTHFFYDFMIPQYMQRVYPLTPVLGDTELSAYVANMANDDDSACLVYVCSAITLLLVQNDKPWTPDCYKQATELMGLSIQLLKPFNLVDHRPTLARLLSRIFIEMCMLVMHKVELAFFYLREAISMILMQGTDRFLDGGDDDNPATDPREERTRRMRIYYLCFIHERHLCIEAQMLVCLDPLPSLPDVADAEPSSIERGWNHIIQTFTVIDHDFARFWRGDRSGASVTAAWILKKHQELTDDSWQHAVDILPFTQQADLIITRQWLRTLTWQIATSNALLSSDAGESEGLSLFMPLRLSTQLKVFLSRMSSEALAVHGMGIIEKLFEITTTIADAVVALGSGGFLEETRSNVHDLISVKSFLLKLPHLKPIHRNIVESKMSLVKSLYDDHGMGELLEPDTLPS